MKAKLQAGADIDFITKAEMKQVLREHALDMLEVEPTRIRAEESAVLDASGNAQIRVYRCPPGRRFSMCVLVVEMDGNDPGNEFHSATAFVEVTRSGGKRVYGTTLAAASNLGIPLFVYLSSSAAPEFVNGEEVVVGIHGFTGNATVNAYVEGPLQPRVPEAVVAA